ncbi:hypothetical protein CAPTEDRAFT_205420 [Capitella teleta]|uniref:Uncharacterized protein n=1 Tax=Capitella teleta TaxID=283909 RepID=R7VE92_CAPTE|nr:hypothetical protein CAPTEDRAFT_205420 [Capitella teleta]|eukprot:ELU13995.1 hypothetical protein CAPTEDRAFT_205420 [Capitella teleta]
MTKFSFLDFFRSLRNNCPAMIKSMSSKDGQHLEIDKIVAKHNRGLCEIVTVYDPFLTSAWLSDTYTQHPHSQDSVPDEKDQPGTSRGVHEAAEELSQERCRTEECGARLDNLPSCSQCHLGPLRLLCNSITFEVF